MTGQSDAAAERSAGEPAREGAEWPVVEVAPGLWRLRAIVELEAEVARLRAALVEAQGGFTVTGGIASVTLEDVRIVPLRWLP